MGALVAVAAALLTWAPAASAAPTGGGSTTGAISTTDDPGFLFSDGSYTAAACLNGNGVNCNIYTDKRDVFFSGLPVSASLGAGTYFFAVLVPGGQPDPNDGSVKNLSSSYDDWTNREFTVDGTGAISYSKTGTHQFDVAGNKLNVFPYDDTSNPGGVYILAVCQVPSGAGATGSGTPGVDPRDCKYDAFKIRTSSSTPPQTPTTAPLSVYKDATGTFTRTYGWSIQKGVLPSEIDQAAGTNGNQGTFNYTVTVSSTGYTDSAHTVTGTITVFNPNLNSDGTGVPVQGVNITDSIMSGGSPDTNATCIVAGGDNATISGGGETSDVFAYTCSWTAGTAPASSSETNSVTAAWGDQTLTFDDNSCSPAATPCQADLPAGSADFMVDFQFTPSALVQNCVTAEDTFNGAATAQPLGVACVDPETWTTDPTNTLTGFQESDASGVFTLTYSRTVAGKSGTCLTYPNTADLQGTSDSSGTSAKLCEGADLTVGTTATPSFTRTYGWSINKTVDKTHVDQSSGSVTLNYKVTATETSDTDSGWAVNGSITVTNPNNWEDITATLSDSVSNGGSCTVNAGTTSVLVPAGKSVTVPYVCTYATQPSYAQATDTATAKWDATAASTPDAQASAHALFTFNDGMSGNPKLVNKTITVQDTYNGGTPQTLGRLTAVDPPATFTSYTWPLSKSVPVVSNACVTINNVGSILETGQQKSVSTQICGPVAGGLTMGFWQNKNGQTIISTKSGTNCQALVAYLVAFNPFADLKGTTSCGTSPSLSSGTSGVLGWVYTTIKNATCSTSGTCNTMLKAQMLASALDVYFSTPSLGGNQISAPAALGGVYVDLSNICSMNDLSGGTGTCSGTYGSAASAFGGATCQTVSSLLTFSNATLASGNYAWGTNYVSNAGGVNWYNQNKAYQVLAKNVFDAINNQAAFTCTP